tara:strand:+ start:2063 stop:2401 length:339 start_codon:yes stop_codon:yes gene_type:complete
MPLYKGNKKEMDDIKPGQRFKSAVCATEVMVVKISEKLELTCGGNHLVPADAEVTSFQEGVSEHMSGSEVGKRYVNEEETIEILCIKAGDGGLAANGALLSIKGSKNLPSSD